jgi:hypothetical protein
MRLSSGGALLPALLLWAVPAAAQEVDPGAAAAVKRVEAAAKAGNGVEFAAGFAEPVGPLIAEFLTVAAKADAAAARLNTAADAKYGKAGRSDALLPGPGARFLESLRRTRAMTVEKAEPDGERVKLIIRVFERDDRGASDRSRVEHWFAVKSGETWKLLPKDADKAAEAMKKQIAAAGKLPDALDRLTAEIAAGKHKTRDDAAAATARVILAVVGSERP